MIGASLTLAWRRFAGGIDLDGLEIYFRTTTRRRGRTGPAGRAPAGSPYGETVRVVNRQLVPVPLTSRRQEVVVVQHMVPAPPPAEEWLAVLTFSTPDVAGQGEFVELTGRIAATLEFLDAEGSPLPPPGPPTGTIGFVPG